MAKQLPKAKERKKVFIVDDHPVFRDGLAGLVGREPDLAVCGEADNAAQALTGVEKVKPDLVLVDIGLPGRSGLELVKDLRTVRPEAGVLVISMHDETLYGERVLRAGGNGYIMKQEGPDKLLEAMRRVLAGEVYLSSSMSSRILEGLTGRTKNDSPFGKLTDRELEVLQLVGQGKDSHAIAKRLNLSAKTVDAHRGHIKEKLSLKNHTELISYAARWVETHVRAGE